MEHTSNSLSWSKTVNFFCALALVACGRIDMEAVEQTGVSLEEVCADRAAICDPDDESCDIESCEKKLAAQLCEPAYRDDGTETCVDDHLDDPTQPLHACDRQLIACIDAVDRDHADEHDIAAAFNSCYERAVECRNDQSTSPPPSEKTCEQKLQECIGLVDGVDAAAQQAGEENCRDQYQCENTPISEPPTEPACTPLESDDPLIDVFPGCQSLFETCEANEDSFGLGDTYCEESYQQCIIDSPPICPVPNSPCFQPWRACLEAAQPGSSVQIEDCQQSLHACYMDGAWLAID